MLFSRDNWFCDEISTTDIAVLLGNNLPFGIEADGSVQEKLM
jgi:hypothetical protein